MARKGHSPEQILGELRQVEGAVPGGKAIEVAATEAGTTEQIYHGWRCEYGGLGIDQARKMKQQQENARLKRAVAEHTLES